MRTRAWWVPSVHAVWDEDVLEAVTVRLMNTSVLTRRKQMREDIARRPWSKEPSIA